MENEQDRQGWVSAAVLTWTFPPGKPERPGGTRCREPLSRAGHPGTQLAQAPHKNPTKDKPTNGSVTGMRVTGACFSGGL